MFSKFSDECEEAYLGWNLPASICVIYPDDVCFFSTTRNNRLITFQYRYMTVTFVPYVVVCSVLMSGWCCPLPCGIYEKSTRNLWGI